MTFFFLSILSGLQFALLAFLSFFGLHRLSLVLQYFRLRSETPKPKREFQTLPRVCVQLPVYNEPRVIERLLHHCVALEYPAELIEFQILDDSNDETSALAASLTKRYREEGIRISHIRRQSREGFKAGALNYGLSLTSAEFVAVFDADFLPTKEFLKKSIHFFKEAEIGMVQHCWGHINSKASLLTRAQTMLLDGHFRIEHTARHRSGKYFNFNGTAGIWRKSAIAEAGGWQGDTLTEDLDLSYRSQLQGTKFVYLVESKVPAELPDSIDAFRSQQHRWTKGSIQVLRKLGSHIADANIPLGIKAEAFFHLGANLCYPVMLLMGLLVLPLLLLWQYSFPENEVSSLLYRGVFSVALIAVIVFYTSAAIESRKVSLVRALLELPLAIISGLALSLSNSIAVLEALSGHQSAFIRTPKSGFLPTSFSTQTKSSWRPWLRHLELLCACYFLLSLCYAASISMWGAVFFLSLYFCGFAFFALESWPRSQSKIRSLHRRFHLAPSISR